MKLKELFEIAVESGIKADPRGKAEVEKLLSEKREKYNKLSAEDKKDFDTDLLTNPYADTRILAGDPEMEITGILTGVDLEVGEVLLADRLNEKGQNINLLITHHPEGKALAALHDVMKVQADEWHSFGVPINIGDSLIGPRMKEVQRGISPVNHNRAVDAASILGFNFMSAHTVADNQVNTFVQKYLDDKKLTKVDEIIKALKEIPEYGQATKDGAGPNIICGSPDSRAGKIFVDMTGGTGGPSEAMEKLANAGVGTIIGMHLSEKSRKEAEKHHINVVIAGHIASDNIGLNLLYDKLQAKGLTDNIIACSGFRRVKR